MFARFFRRTSSLLLVGQFLFWLSAWAGDKEEVVADPPKKRAPAIPFVVFGVTCSLRDALAAAWRLPARGRERSLLPNPRRSLLNRVVNNYNLVHPDCDRQRCRNAGRRIL